MSDSNESRKVSGLDTEGWSNRTIEVLHLYLSGLPYKEISKKTGLAPQTVANMASKYNFHRLRHQRDQAKVNRAAQEYLEREEHRKRGRSSIFGNPPSGFTPDLRLHPGQQDAFDQIEANAVSSTPAAIITLICGRGWGKTAFLGYLLVKFLEAHPNSSVLWVAPFTSTCMSLVDDFFNGINEETGQRFIEQEDAHGNKVWEFSGTKSGPMLRWWNGATVSFRSAENPESIVSKGYHRVIVDEAALIANEMVFKQRILGVARKKDAKVFLISTPRGKNWIYPLFLKGQDPSESNYLSIHQPYSRNPYFSKTLETLIHDLPEYLYRQEYLAEFIEDGQSVFRGIERCIVGPEVSFPSAQQEWHPDIEGISNRRFVVGLDLAKSIDFTVLYGMDIDSGECVYYRRFNRCDYKEVLRIAAEACKRLNDATLVYDSTGVGAGLGDFIDEYGISSHAFTFTNESKNELINKLILAIEHGKIKIPSISTILKELRGYSFEVTKTGKITFNAPAGSHDDCVIALALSNYFREEHGLTRVECEVIDEIIAFNSGIGRPRNFFEEMAQDDD